MPSQEVMIPAALPMPDGYAFLSKSDKYMTGLCRKRTRAADKILYIVSEKTVLRGLYAPESVVTEIPKESLKHIAWHTMRKGSGRVGRSSQLSLQEKARLAVTAYVRHRHTNYDQIIREVGQQKARESIRNSVLEKLREWKGQCQTPVPAREARSKKRKREPPPQEVPTEETDAGLAKKQHKQENKRRQRERQPERRKKESVRSPRRTRASARLTGSSDPGLQKLQTFFDDEDDAGITDADDVSDRAEGEYDDYMTETDDTFDLDTLDASSDESGKD